MKDDLMRTFADESGSAWSVALGRESFGTYVLLFTREDAPDVRKSVLPAESSADAEAEFAGLSDDALRARLASALPWS